VTIFTSSISRTLCTTAAAGLLASCAVSTVDVSAATAAAKPAAQAGTTRVGHQTREVKVAARSDSYVSYQHPTLRPGHRHSLVAVGSRRDRKVVYVKFHVGGMPNGSVVTYSSLDLARAQQYSPAATLRLYRVRSTHWSQRRLDARNRPRSVRKLAVSQVGSRSGAVSFPVRMKLRAHHSYSFAVTSSAQHAATKFKSRESGAGPKLALQLDVPVVTVPTPISLPIPTPTPPTPTPPGPCALSSTLVPSCGALLGGYLTSFGGSNVDSAYTNFNSESGSSVSVAHDYLRPGSTLSSSDRAVAQTPGALLLLNWKPVTSWAEGAGGNAAVNAQIDAMALSIKSLGTTKIFLSLFHEPENDVSGGAADCPSSIYKGGAGTPADYRAMWANVESRFAALGVTNVVWTMNYMGFSNWNCMIDDLWPGNDLVDWVLFDPYVVNQGTFSSSVSPFYNELTSLSDASHDYLSKPWGLGEFGDGSSSDASQEGFYSAAAHSLDTGEFPKLKLLTFFDAIGPVADYRVAYNAAGVWDPKELADLQTLSDDPVIQAGRASIAGG
jgi:hypothetical protein